MTRVSSVVIVLLTLTSSESSAQTSRPPVEAGVGLSGLVAVPYEDFGVPEQSPAADFRVTVPISPRFSIEGQMSLTHHGGQFGSGVDSLYMIQVKQRIASGTRGGFHPFLTYGALGFLEHERVNPYTVTLPNGTATSSAGFSYTSVDEPYGLVVGGGVQQQIGKHLAVRAEAQMMSFLWIPLGARFSATLSVPFGSYPTK